MGMDEMEVTESRTINYGHYKVFRHGPYSLAVGIPAGFVKDNDLKPGEEVKIVSEGGGTITVKKEMK